MAKRLFLHIGTMKAATTYLQSLFDVNRERLAEQGVLWQSSQLNQEAILDFQGSPMASPTHAGSWPKLRDGVRAADGDVLMSMELLARLPQRRIKRLVEALDVEELHVILTVRDLMRIAPSAWQETTQNRGTEPWASWIEKVCTADPRPREGRLDFWQHHYLPSIIESWSEVVPVSRIHLVTIPQQRSDSSAVWERFASVIGVDPEGFVEHSFSNAALGGTSAELMRRLNLRTEDMRFPQYRWGFKSVLAKRTLAERAKSEPRPTIPLELQRRLHKTAGAMIDDVRASGVHVVGDLAELVPAEPSEPASPFDPGQATDHDLLEAALDGLAGLGRRHGALQLKMAELERERSGDGKPPAGGVRWAVRSTARSVLQRGRSRVGALRSARTMRP